MVAASKKPSRAHWTTKVYRAGEEPDMAEHAGSSLDEIPPHDRAAVAWQLSLEAFSLAEPDTDHERRLPRSAFRVARR